jgi:hypothetical protein
MAVRHPRQEAGLSCGAHQRLCAASRLADAQLEGPNSRRVHPAIVAVVCGGLEFADNPPVQQPIPSGWVGGRSEGMPAPATGTPVPAVALTHPLAGGASTTRLDRSHISGLVLGECRCPFATSLKRSGKCADDMRSTGDVHTVLLSFPGSATGTAG